MEKTNNQLTLQFYVWSSLILQLHEYEKALPMFTSKPTVQKRRAAHRTELNRLYNLLKTSFTNAEIETMHEAASVFGQALTCSIMDSKATTDVLDQLYETLKAKQNDNL